MTSASRGTYAKSVTRENTLRRPVSANSCPSQATVHPPDSGSTTASSSPVANVALPPACSSRMRSEL